MCWLSLALLLQWMSMGLIVKFNKLKELLMTSNLAWTWHLKREMSTEEQEMSGKVLKQQSIQKLHKILRMLTRTSNLIFSRQTVLI